MNFKDSELVQDFSKISSIVSLNQFIDKYGLVEREPIIHQVSFVTSSLNNVLGEYAGIVDNLNIVVIHRWHDLSQAFSIQSDIEKIILQIFDLNNKCLYGSLVEFTE